MSFSVPFLKVSGPYGYREKSLKVALAPEGTFEKSIIYQLIIFKLILWFLDLND